MKIRLSGTREEIADVADAIATVLDVRETSDFYPNRGSTVLGRVYLDAIPRPTTIRADAERSDKPTRRRLPPGRIT